MIASWPRDARLMLMALTIAAIGTIDVTIGVTIDITIDVTIDVTGTKGRTVPRDKKGA